MSQYKYFSSPIGMQPKRSDGRFIYKENTSNGNENIAEWLISLFLESCSNSPWFVKYRIVNKTSCSCESWGVDLRFVSAYQIIYQYLMKYDTELLEKIENKGVVATEETLFNYWVKSFYNRMSATERVSALTTIFSVVSGLDEDSILAYFSSLTTLDVLFFNHDRHFGNFGMVFYPNSEKWSIAPIFDNGMSLGVGLSKRELSRIVKNVNLKSIRFKPFSSSRKKSLQALEVYNYEVNWAMFRELFHSTNWYGDGIFSTNEWRIFRTIVRRTFGVDLSDLEKR